VVDVADDGKIFCVELPDGKGMQVHRNQQAMLPGQRVKAFVLNNSVKSLSLNI
jgi:hypothetical protein